MEKKIATNYYGMPIEIIYGKNTKLLKVVDCETGENFIDTLTSDERTLLKSWVRHRNLYKGVRS